MEPYGVGLAIAQTVPATMPHAGDAAAVFLPVRGFPPVRSYRRWGPERIIRRTGSTGCQPVCLSGLHTARGCPRPSPDAHYGHPALRSLDADFAPPSMASLVSNAGSWARAAPRCPP